MTKPHRSALRASGLATTVFAEYAALVHVHSAVNLGVGTPDFDAPAAVLDIAVDAIRNGHNQYASVDGSLVLRAAIAEHAERFYGQRVAADTMVTVTSGATEAMMDTVLALVDPGDRVVMFEPGYDAHRAAVTMAGGVVDPVALHPPDEKHRTWWFDDVELAAAFTSRTRLVILNTPHNPTGKVFTRDELEVVAALCRRHRVPVVVDEVYEHIVFAGAQHVRLGSLDGMRELAITISSGGKTFNVTGWKVGWIIAAPELTAAICRVHQYVTACTPLPLQLAVAYALRLPDRYFAELAQLYEVRRDHTHQLLATAGLRTLRCDGTFYALVDVQELGFASDAAFCQMLVAGVGVAAIPLSPFLSRPDQLGRAQFVRFAFCKHATTLAAAGERLLRLHDVAARTPRGGEISRVGTI